MLALLLRGEDVEVHGREIRCVHLSWFSFRPRVDGYEVDNNVYLYIFLSILLNSLWLRKANCADFRMTKHYRRNIFVLEPRSFELGRPKETVT